ncbi:hypothetical protein JCM15579A_04410 [Marinifilum fragile]
MREYEYLDNFYRIYFVELVGESPAEVEISKILSNSYFKWNEWERGSRANVERSWNYRCENWIGEWTTVRSLQSCRENN